MRSRRQLTVWSAGIAVVLAVPLVVAGIATSATAAPPGRPASTTTSTAAAAIGTLPAPPPAPSATPSAPGIVRRTTTPAPLRSLLAATRTAGTNGTIATTGNAAPGANPNLRTLVLYDTTGTWGWLGEAYAVESANLISHGSAYVMQPVEQYTSGEMAGYTGVVYVGSTYDNPVPTALLDDVLSRSRPVVWMNDNIWQLAARASNFAGQYGWTPGYFDYSVTPTVTYKGVGLVRSSLAAPSGLLGMNVTDTAKATVLATANRSDGTTEPWAVSSGNLTYIGEIPYSYVGDRDRYLAAADILERLANPLASIHRCDG